MTNLNTSFPVDPKTRVGYEIEHIHPLRRSDFKKAFATHMGIQFDNPWPNWDAKDDCSLGRSPNSKATYCHELTTPPLMFSETLSILKKTFDWMIDTDADTNNSCGLHIGMSIEGVDLRTQLDPLKLIVLCDDFKILELWNRSTRVASALAIVRNNQPKTMSEAYPSIRLGRCSINLGNYTHAEQNYIEFRSPGNQDYHKRFDDVAATVLNFAGALTAACDPDAYVEEYARSLKDKLRIDYEPYAYKFGRQERFGLCYF